MAMILGLSLVQLVILIGLGFLMFWPVFTMLDIALEDTSWSAKRDRLFGPTGTLLILLGACLIIVAV